MGLSHTLRSTPLLPHALTGTARELRGARKSRAAGGWAAGRESGAGERVEVAGRHQRGAKERLRSHAGEPRSRRVASGGVQRFWRGFWTQIDKRNPL
jgi:hypothetical protein